MKSRERLGLLHWDGSITVYSPAVGVDQARAEAADFDENQDDPAFFTTVVSLRVEDIKPLDVPSLKTAPEKRGVRQTSRNRIYVV
jgi:hypothetical protein